MCAYAVGFCAERVTLVYPTGTGHSANRRLLLSTMIGSHPITIDSVELPMAKRPDACKIALQGICSRDGCCAAQVVIH
jgi:hypothetical protein